VTLPERVLKPSRGLLAQGPWGFFIVRGEEMAKRFTDSTKWQNGWFLSLDNDKRMIWLFILDNCTIAGRWRKNFKLLNFSCNTNITEDEFKSTFEGRVIERDDYYFIPKYLKYQYRKGLNSNKPAILSVREELVEYGLISMINELFGNDYVVIDKSLKNDCQIIKDKDKVKDKDKEKEKEKEKKDRYGEYKNVTLSEKELIKLNNEFGIDKTKQAIEFLSAYKIEKKYKTNSDYLTLRRWVFDAVEKSFRGGFKNFAGKPISDMPRMQAILDETMRLYGPKPEGKTNES
jgi:hypothetical protein